MGTVILDFDSTVVRCESLEEILRPLLADQPGALQEIEAVTRLGMEGRIGFGESLQRRLAIAAPTRDRVVGFGDDPECWITPGMDALVADLLREQIDVHIVSGGLFEAITPVAQSLGIPAEKVHAVRLRWSPEGTFLGIDADDPFSESKVEGVKSFASSLAQPRLGVGDGMTDYHLYEHGLVDHFIAFVQHARRESVLATGCPVATDVDELRRQIHRILAASS